jgi:hypothetical protein
MEHVLRRGTVCAYCGEPVLTGREKPEHPIPAALGSSLAVRTVCDPCNAMAGREIDQPLLADDVLKISRSLAQQVDPRRRQERTIPNPLLTGRTADGTVVYSDADGQPVVQRRVVNLGEGKQVLTASSEDEMGIMLREIDKRAARDGMRVLRGEQTRSRFQPEISVNISTNVLLWHRAAAKIALGVASHVYPEQWRVGDHAIRLRAWLRGRDPLTADGLASGLLPTLLTGPLGQMVARQEHALWFVECHDEGGRRLVMLFVILFGQLGFGLPVDSTGALPPRAWRLDSRRPKADGETTFDQLLRSHVARSNRAWTPE